MGFTKASNIETSKKSSIAISFSSKKTMAPPPEETKMDVKKSILEVEDEKSEDDTVDPPKKEVQNVKPKQKEKRKSQITSSSSSYKNKKMRYENWLHVDILVLIKSKICNGIYYKRKGIIDKVLNNGFTAQLEVLDSSSSKQDGGDIIQLDQDDLQTVIPSKIGKQVRIVNGERRGCLATIVRLDDTVQCADLSIENDIIK